MTDFWQDDPEDGTKFSWDEWFYQGMRALRKTLFRYDFGLPDAFWEHLQSAFVEFLAAMRILLKALWSRQRKQRPPSTSPPRGSIDVEWEE